MHGRGRMGRVCGCVKLWRETLKGDSLEWSVFLWGSAGGWVEPTGTHPFYEWMNGSGGIRGSTWCKHNPLQFFDIWKMSHAWGTWQHRVDCFFIPPRLDYVTWRHAITMQTLLSQPTGSMSHHLARFICRNFF